MDKLPIVKEVTPLHDYRLYIRFDDGVSGELDLSDKKGKGVFAIWNDYETFKNVYYTNHGAIAWNEDVEIDSLNCYLTLTGKTFEQYAGC